MTTRTNRIVPVRRQPLPHRQIRRHRTLIKRRHRRRRSRRRRPQHILQHQHPAQHRRCPRRIRGYRQNTPLSQQAPTPAIRRQSHSPEPAAINARNPIMPRQTLIQKRVIRLQKRPNTPVFAQHAIKEQLRLLPETLPQIIVKIAKQIPTRNHRINVPQPQPLPRKIGSQIERPPVRQHPPRLPFQFTRRAQRPASGEVQQRIIRHTAPQEEGQPRSQFQITNLVNTTHRNLGRIRLHPEQKLRVRQHRRNSGRNTSFKTIRPSSPEIRHRPFHLARRKRPPVCPAHQSGKDRHRTGITLLPANKQPLPAWRIARALGRKRPRDSNLIHRRRRPRMPPVIKPGHRWLPGSIDQRRARFHKRDRQLMRPRLHRDAHLQWLLAQNFNPNTLPGNPEGMDRLPVN